jgi:hypothetical protein
MVGVTRLERATSWSQTMHSTNLNYTPRLRFLLYTISVLFAMVFCNKFTCYKL